MASSFVSRQKKLLTCLLGQFEEALPDNEKVKRAGKYVAAALHVVPQSLILFLPARLVT